MAQHILTVTLSPVLDQMANLSGFSLGKDMYLPEFTMSAGGKGINVTRTLNHLKMKSLATGFVGGPTGNLIEKMLDREKIRHDFIHIPQDPLDVLPRSVLGEDGADADPQPPPELFQMPGDRQAAFFCIGRQATLPRSYRLAWRGLSECRVHSFSKSGHRI